MGYLISIIVAIVAFGFVVKKIKALKEQREKEKKHREREQRETLTRKTYTMYWENLSNVYSSERMKNLYSQGYTYEDLVEVVQRISDNFVSSERKPEIRSYYRYPDTGRRHDYRLEKIAKLRKMLGNPKWKYSIDGERVYEYDYPILASLDLDYLLRRPLKMPWEIFKA